MSDTAFDILGAARKLKASGFEAEQSETIVEVVSQSTSRFVTVEHFDASIAVLRQRIDSVQTELNARIDAVRADLRTDIAGLRAEFSRSILIMAGIIIGAVGLMMTILGFVLTNGAALS